MLPVWPRMRTLTLRQFLFTARMVVSATERARIARIRQSLKKDGENVLMVWRFASFSVQSIFFPSQFTLRMGQSLHLSLSNIDMYYVPLENKHHLPNYHITPSLSP
jgi:hypothetical protein